MTGERVWVCCCLLFYTFGVVTLGGYLTTDHWHNRRWFRRLPNWLWTLFGLSLVGLGTLLGTRTWNELADLEKRDEMVKAIIMEVVRNKQILADWQEKGSEESDLTKYTLYTPLHSGALVTVHALGSSDGAFWRAKWACTAAATNLKALRFC